jgi:hypothetical protein
MYISLIYLHIEIFTILELAFSFDSLCLMTCVIPEPGSCEDLSQEICKAIGKIESGIQQEDSL